VIVGEEGISIRAAKKCETKKKKKKKKKRLAQ
jgi:hypothetical protein